MRSGVFFAVALIAAGVAAAELAACGGGSAGPTDETAFGKPCGCPNIDASAPGDWMCTTTNGPCSGTYFCLNGTCTRACSLDDAGGADVCPAGAICKRTVKSSLAVYCATN